MNNSIKRILKRIVDKYLLHLFLLVVVFIGAVVIYKTFIKKPTYVYVKVKVGQGLWWASTLKPSPWYVDAIKRAQPEQDFLKRDIARILTVRSYPWGSSSQFDVYVDLKLMVQKIGTTGKYSFNRSTLAVGAPVDFEFDQAQFSGTVIQLSEHPITNKQVEKTVVLTKKNTFPWEFDEIPVGDTYNDGVSQVIEVVSKDSVNTIMLAEDSYGNVNGMSTTPSKYVTVVLKIKGIIDNDRLMYGVEQVLSPGKEISLTTEHFVFENYTVSDIK